MTQPTVAVTLGVVVEQLKNVQTTLNEMKESMREDRVNGEKRLQYHVEAINPHPAQESWLRDQHGRMDERVKRLESAMSEDHGHDKAVRWLVGVALTEGVAIASLVAQLLH